MLQQTTQPLLRRTGKTTDVKALEHLFADAFRRQAAPYSSVQVAAALESGVHRAAEQFARGCGLAAILDDDLVGCAAWTFEESSTAVIPHPFMPEWPRPIVAVRSFCVAPQAAGRGIGRLLLERALRHARDEGAATVALNATICALPFYRRCGFHVVEEAKAILGGVAFPYAVMVREWRR